MSDWSKILGFIGKCYIAIASIASFIAGIVLAISEESIMLFVLVAIGGFLVTIVSAAFIMTIAEIGNNVAAIRKNSEIQNRIVNSSGSSYFKVKTLKPFNDSKTGVSHEIGDVFEVSKERYNEIISKGNYIEIC